MYVKHSHLNLHYSDSDKIWRYMDFTKFSSLINEGSFSSAEPISLVVSFMISGRVFSLSR